ncbi:Gfo/Idh/MocA family protein [Companilactobacillus sp.]|jgi:virulence factor|uniref:Gfo/Idh/MocA family protein n=1 Tax=Companilactobacillus sp. TaxID=2767905 RepID=UPI0025BABAA2|nr:Gfo/Idh/MocA family oxidoreductase [Companilactobacillus sp.]MCH4009815.1 Gfo/Idh/MocA family oxidoreductase [Companilactobacillus sp.]MCH4052509.1 Gfo/Idh/MocA family oxidoreductase [Companilactobacillus sp.]MCH4077757.1 Gfo/Idh/MocA family oxidoreductase [Companilactobacillus sp.]MCH4126333.1 Gfo/Idh/MocA family oxidoreductase [Companilactobacillus sp.]MCI1312041.1 Gfo/Idh/MocA family oxidoreductase [Companilactobacillus sp.]
MEKIGVIGLGNIAQKAYLPVMARLQDKFEWHLTTRNPEKGAELTQKYGFSHHHQTLDELIAEHPLAVFVHTPTKTHAKIIEQLLDAGINVFVDKPVSDDLDEVIHLYDLAKSKGLMLTCGFNRRFAPFNDDLKDLTDKRTITVEKTRTKVLQKPKDAIFDLAIHSVDTALYLLDDQKIDSTQTRIVTDSEGNLAQYYLTIDAENTRINVTTNMESGVNLEKSTVQSTTERASVINLNLLEKYQSDSIQQFHRPDWEDTLYTRGFEPMIMAFLSAVTGKTENPISPESAILSHRICTESLKDI